MSDLIDRQAAISYAISGRIRTLPTSEDGENWIRTSEVRQSLLTMPSAQPELIERTAYIRGFEQGRTQGMIDSTIKAEWTNADALDLQSTCNQLATDCISRQAAIDAVETIGFDFSDSGLSAAEIEEVCEAIGEVRQEWSRRIKRLPSAQPERTCVNCGRTANNGGWYSDGRTRCPIEEHYALPKDGFCHLWEKRNITDDDYPERREG